LIFSSLLISIPTTTTIVVGSVLEEWVHFSVRRSDHLCGTER